MKKIFTTILLLGCIATANAQNKCKVKYQGEVQTGYGIGIGAASFGRVYFQTIQGVRVNQYFSIGVGLGANLYTNYTYKMPEVYMPIFLNAKGYLPVGDKTDLFLSLDLGYSFGLTKGISGRSGLMFTPAIGVSLKTKKENSVNISLGFDNQRWSSGAYGINDGAISIKVGYQF